MSEYNPNAFCIYCLQSFNDGDKYCCYCGAPLVKPDNIEETFAHIPDPAPRKNVPTRKVCANCHQSYHEGDKYCRYCGAPMGKPDYIEETFACIYGPAPMERVHKCTQCGYTWETCTMVDKERFCPKCGGSAPY